MRTPFHVRWAPNRDAPGQPLPPSSEQAKFQDLLRELFQFDCADLDFGIYRIMNRKRTVVDRYIDQELPSAIEKAVGEGAIATEAERARIFEETRDQLIEFFGEDAVAPSGELVKYQETPLGQKYILWRERARHSESASDVRRDIYNHLYSFFSRYYQDGDFFPKRRYSWEHPYVVPYNGEEVHFHWANRDQYYVKAAEHFTDYTYRTRSGVSVRFSVRSAHVEQNDVKGKTRSYFPLVGETNWDAERRMLEVPFDHRLPTAEEAKDLKKNGQQKIILERAEASVPEALAGLPEAAKALLDHCDVEAGDDDVSSLFRYHARRFARKRTSDFFIHRDLGGFLARELDHYLRSEVLRLRSLVVGGEARADAWVDKVRLIRDVGANVIDFLAQIEGFQKMLWEKRKFAVDVQYCVAMELIPRDLLPRVAECEAQWDEWRTLGCIAKGGSLFIDGDDSTTRLDFLNRNPGLLLDTRHFEPDLVDDMLAALDDIDERTDGIAIKSENWQALNLLQERHRGALPCVYIDPPYNTGDSEILYKNGYLLSSWISLMADRLEMASGLLGHDAAVFVAIDDFELRDLCALVDSVLARFRRELIIVNHHPQGGKAKTLSTTHEYMVTCVAGDCVLRRRADSVEKRPFKRSGTAESNFRKGRPNSFYAILIDVVALSVKGIEKPPPPADDDSYPTESTPEGYVRVYPIGTDGSERVWRRSYESCLKLVADEKLTVTKKMTVYQVLEPDDRSAAVFSNWTGKRHNAGEWGANLLTDIMGDRNTFSYPKSIHTVADAVGAVSGETTLDYFAGSGTTGHAIINLNREDGGHRKFILVEMGDHFDTVLMPRLKKVAFSPEWKNGTATREATSEEAARGPRIIKYFRMESYEDTLNNIEFEQADEGLFGLEDYMLRYMLQWETKGSATLLNVAGLERPFDYTLKLDGNGDGADVKVDLPETFNYLLGLAVKTRRVYDDEGRRYLVYAGRTRDGRNAVIIWRNTAGWTLEDRERDRDFVTAHDLTAGADDIWMNGDSLVKGARPLDTLFKQRMFAPAGG